MAASCDAVDRATGSARRTRRGDSCNSTQSPDELRSPLSMRGTFGINNFFRPGDVRADPCRRRGLTEVTDRYRGRYGNEKNFRASGRNCPGMSLPWKQSRSNADHSMNCGCLFSTECSLRSLWEVLSTTCRLISRNHGVDLPRQVSPYSQLFLVVLRVTGQNHSVDCCPGWKDFVCFTRRMFCLSSFMFMTYFSFIVVHLQFFFRIDRPPRGLVTVFNLRHRPVH